MSEHSGKFAKLGGVSTTSGWTLDEQNDAKEFSTSNLACGMARRKGKCTWTGTVKGYGGMPPFMPGEEFSFFGYTAPDNDISGPGQTAVGVARVSQVVITWNYADSEILDWQITFQGCLGLSWQSLDITDTTFVDNIDTICGAGIKTAHGGEFVDFEHVTQVVLTITNDLKLISNSSTIVDGVCTTDCRAGKTDFTLAITQECNERDDAGGLPSAPPKGTDCEFQLFINNTEFWDLKWAHVMGYAGLTADNDSADILTRTINFAKNGAVDGQGLGHIIKPDLVQFWPAVTP